MAVECEEAYASVLLASPRFDRLSAADRSLLEEISLGTLRWRGELDWLIRACSNRTRAALDAEVQVALRIALYQLVHLERVPAHAAVNDAVETVKAAKKKSAAGFVNAVLRRAVNNGPRLLAELREQDDLDSLAASLSHPPWLAGKWIADFGREEALALMRANNKRPSEGLRSVPFVAPADETRARLEQAGAVLEASRIAPGAYRVRSAPADVLRAAMAEGSIALQDEGSQLAAGLVGAQPGNLVLDLCVAPGGKTAVMAAAMRGEGRIIAGDLYPHRLSTTRRLLLTQKTPNVSLVAWNVRSGLPLSENVRFDRILVDAPCSGTGTLRRHPEIKWRLSHAQIEELCRLQLQFLCEAARWLREDGRLVYSTCSLEREENEQVVGVFLAQHPQYVLAEPRTRPLETESEGSIRTFPHRHGTDGFFVACLQQR